MAGKLKLTHYRLADRFMAGCKGHLRIMDGMTPGEKWKQTIHYKKKMAEIMKAAGDFPTGNTDTA